MPGILVRFEIVEGSGAIGSKLAFKESDQEGKATVVYRTVEDVQTGGQEGKDVVQISLANYSQIPPVTITITKTYLIKPALLMFSGNNQVGIVGRCLREPLKVKVVDTNHSNAPIGGLEVEFEVIQGQGILVEDHNIKPVSSGEGVAGIQLILGREPDAEIKVRARIALRQDQEVVFTAVGKLPKLKAIQGK
jgi:hypothetical protein